MHKIITTGDEPEVAQAVIWLERLGITRDMIRSVNIFAEVGQPLMIQPTLMVPVNTDPDDELVNVKADPRPETLLDYGQRMEDPPEPVTCSRGHKISGYNSRGTCDLCEMEDQRAGRVPEPSPVQRDRCPCGAGWEHAGQGDQEQHADWIDRRPSPAMRPEGY